MKKFTPFLFSSSLIIPTMSYAIGLSGIQVASHLNQPLSAQIQLMAIEGISLSEIQVTLASSTEYDSVGMERSYELAKVHFSLSKNKQGKAVINITSDGPIDEPYLQFLLDIRWPNGKMVRGYTVLLDPPNYKVVAKPAATLGKALKKSSAVKAKPFQQAVVEQDDDVDLTTESEAKLPAPATVTKADNIAPSNAAANVNAASEPASQAVANTPEIATKDVPLPQQAESKSKESTVISKQAEPVDSIPTVLQTPEIATMSQPTPMKDVTKSTPMDIENIDENPVAELSAPERTGDAEATPTTAPVTTTTSTAKAATPANQGGASVGSKNSAAAKSFKVGQNDSLWNIAKKVQVDSPINLNQVMMALKKANPDAFIHNNMNGLKQGAVLNVPNYNTMKSVQSVDAAKAVYAQNQAWKQPTDQAAPAVEKPEHPLRNIPAKSVTIENKPQLNFRVTDIEQTPTLRPGENPGKAPQPIVNPTVSVSASAASQAQQSDAFLKNSMADYVKANEMLKKRLSNTEQENAQLRAELIKLTETIQEQGIKRQSVKMDVQEGPNLPSQVHEVEVDAPQDNTMRIVMWILLALTSSAAGVWFWQRRNANAFAQDRVMATPSMATDTAAPVYGATPAAQSLRFSQMEKTVIDPIADEGDTPVVEETKHDNSIDYRVDDTGATPIEGDPYATKLDLAQAYIAMEDTESAIPLLREVMESGNEEQRQEAHRMLTKIT